MILEQFFSSRDHHLKERKQHLSRSQLTGEGAFEISRSNTVNVFLLLSFRNLDPLTEVVSRFLHAVSISTKSTLLLFFNDYWVLYLLSFLEKISISRSIKI